MNGIGKHWKRLTNHKVVQFKQISPLGEKLTKLDKNAAVNALVDLYRGYQFIEKVQTAKTSIEVAVGYDSEVGKLRPT